MLIRSKRSVPVILNFTLKRHFKMASMKSCGRGSETERSILHTSKYWNISLARDKVTAFLAPKEVGEKNKGEQILGEHDGFSQKTFLLLDKS